MRSNSRYLGDRAKGFATEARLFGEMAVTDVSRQLIFLFFAGAALKKDTGVGVADVKPLPVEKIGILGAGFMGAGIAAIAAMQGTVVRLKDAQLERVGKGLREVSTILREQLKRKRITKRQLEDQLTLVGGTIDYSGFAGASIVIEAVFEDLKVKQSVLAESGSGGAERDLRVEHEHDSDRADRGERGASGACARDALLLARCRRCRCSR